MISSVLVVCIGNVCRSPVAARLLALNCPELKVESAGLGALVDHEIDPDFGGVATENGVDISGHKARQFSAELASAYDLILVMEKNHIRTIANMAPQLQGKTMLFGHWIGPKEISDPYRRSQEFHKAVFDLLQAASTRWSEKLSGKSNG